MKDYVVDHFNEEEAYQAKINYPELEAHKKAHASFKEGIENYVKIFEEEGFNEDRIQEFGGKLMTWLIMHVAGMDQKIGEYVKAKEDKFNESRIYKLLLQGGKRCVPVDG